MKAKAPKATAYDQHNDPAVGVDETSVVALILATPCVDSQEVKLVVAVEMSKS